MVSSEAKNGFNCVSCGTFYRDEANCGVVRQHENPARGFNLYGGARGGFREHISYWRDVQAIFCRRRHQPSRPPPAKIRPGRPAPTMGPGTPTSLTTMLSRLPELAELPATLRRPRFAEPYPGVSTLMSRAAPEATARTRPPGLRRPSRTAAITRPPP